jgi:branched-subunit amino acid aminotransferase/4-amino-4-deoxychorismate lyase
MPVVWIDNQLRTLDGLTKRERSLLAARSVPTAVLVLRSSWLRPGAAVDGIAWIRKVGSRLGLKVAPGIADQVSHAPDGTTIALVGPGLEEVGRGPLADGIANVAILPMRTVDDTRRLASLRLLTSPWPVNHLSPIASLLLVSDGDYAAGQRAATAAGLDAALVLNLAGDVARVGRSALLLQTTSGEVVTPELASGAPDTAWRTLTVTTLDVVERRVTPAELLGASAAVTLNEDGTTSEVSRVGSQRLPSALEFCHLIDAAVRDPWS